MFQGMRDATQQCRPDWSARASVSDPAIATYAWQLVAPARIAASMGVGNFIRQPYKATLPDPMNPTETTNPLASWRTATSWVVRRLAPLRRVREGAP